MRAYVTYYEPHGARAREAIGDTSIRDDQYVVQFSRTAAYVTQNIEAHVARDEMNAARVHSVRLPVHVCQFEVEQVGEFEYAIVCPDPPSF